MSSPKKNKGIGQNKQFGKLPTPYGQYFDPPEKVDMIKHFLEQWLRRWGFRAFRFCPIQKLSVPDFQHISNQYEQMQNDHLQNRKRKQVKNFTIRKATNPNQRNVQASADATERSVITSPKGYHSQQPSLLTQEEQDALMPKEVVVENPWIYEQTHQEYLENIKGLPARHANVIKKHHDVQIDKTFLSKIENLIDKDEATKEAITLLNKEYEIFQTEDMPGVKVLTRYDTQDEDRSIEQWVEYCQARPGQAHALSPVYQGYEYCWKPVEVLDFDYTERKFRVKVVATGQEKLVTRLSLLFFDEDPDLFKERVNQCKQRQQVVEAELRFTNIVDTVPTEAVSTLSKERRIYFLSKSVRESDKFDPDKIYATFKGLLRVVEEEYIRQMKKCVILKEMEDPANYPKFNRMKIPIRLTRKTSPYFGVVRCPKYNFNVKYDEIQGQHFSCDNDLVTMTKIFIQKCIDFQEQRFMNTNKDVLRLPRELKDLVSIQSSHHQAVTQNMMIQWRDYLIGEIQDKLRKNHNFFEGSSDTYESSPLKRIISRFEYILNTYLREFVNLSINDWVGFIKYFTMPDHNNDELWKVNDTPFVVISLSVKKKEKNKKEKKKEKPKVEEKKVEEVKEEPPKEEQPKVELKEGEEPVPVPEGGEVPPVEEIPAEESDEDEKNRVIFRPSIAECEEFILSSMDKIIKSTNMVNNLESDLMPFLQKDGVPNFLISHEFPWVSEAAQKLRDMILSNIGDPNGLLKKYKKYEYVLNVDKKALIDDLFKGGEDGAKKSLEEIKQVIISYEKAHYEIMTLSEDEVNFRIFRVMAKKIKEQLGDAADKIRIAVLDATYNHCVTTVNETRKTYNDMQDKITHEPLNERELLTSKDFIQVAPKMVEELTETLKEIEHHYLMLEEFSYMYKEEDINGFWFMKIWPLKIQAALTDGKNTIAERNEAMSAKLETEKEAFNKQIIQFQDHFDRIKEFKSLDQSKDFNMEAFALYKDINKAHDLVRQFHDREILFGLPETPYPDLEDIDKSFKPFFDLITMSFDVQMGINEWTSDRLMGQDPNKIQSEVQKWNSSCLQLYKKLNEDYPETSEVCQALRTQIEGFSKNLPLIKCLTSEAINLEEDWKDIIEVIDQKPEDFIRDEIKVTDFEQLGLHKFIEQIEEITMKAEKKFSLGIKLKLMKEDMKQFELFQRPFKGTFLLGGFDDINAKLDDQIVTTQAMLGSSYIGKGKLKADSRAWEVRLNYMSELFDEILKVQRTWMYLEPIFSSGDIGMTMPNEAKAFQQVDKLWKDTMEGVEQEKAIMDLQEKEGIRDHFKEANKKLDVIQKKLNDYLEQKRLVFARFFFLANEDLLQILAQTKDPRLVQAHMDKCFEGIAKVMFTPEDHVEGMISAEKETVMFIKKIDVNEGDKKGNVEKWMLEIEEQMVKSLTDLCSQALVAYPNTKRTEWSKMWPGQVVLAISQIFWTTEVEEAIGDYEQNGLEEYVKKLQLQIEDIVLMVRKPLEDQVRITLKALVVMDVHARDVVRDLANKGIQNAADFDWTAQLRFYWETFEGVKNTLVVKMVTAEIKYSYEYLGNSARLVITPLTDRCYRTLLGAKYLNYGGAPEGPAGTGKTESVKDLAKAIAIQCVVFNCSDGLDYLAMAKFFKGLAQSGAWCCFDEFNRIDLEVLSVIAQQIQSIQHAIKDKKKKTFIFEKTELRINRSCAVNITMNPGYAGRSELPDNLKALFRPCAMMVPDYALISQIELYSFGFSDADPLSVKVVASLRLSSEQLSSQDHYDFGMRAVKSILTACGNQRRILADWPEDQICLKALNDVNCPKFTSNDIPLFRGITSDLFPGITLPEQDYAQLFDNMLLSCKNNNIQAKQIFLDKCIQLYETLMVRHGLMVVGDPYAGKSSIINTLKEAMSMIKDDPKFVNVLTYFVNPKSVTQNQLYGVFDMDTQEWSDGVLAIKIRDCAESESPDRKWIIFDGPVDAVWIENMNTVLDDNKKLCLNSGQIIKLKPTMTIMFQVDDLSQASPATISRCGMVLLEAQQLGHNVFITSFCNVLREFLEPKIVAKFEKMFNYIADICVEYTRKNCVFPCPGTGPFVVNHMIRLIDTYIMQHKPKPDVEEESKMPENMEDRLNNALVFAAIWGIGGCIEESTRSKFDTMFQELLIGEDVVAKFEIDMGKDYTEEPMKIPNKLGDFKSLFEVYFDQEEMKWVNWMSTVPKYIVNKEDSYLQLSIPTLDSIRLSQIFKTLVTNDKHVLMVGPTGTGKSLTINQLLKAEFDNEQWSYFALGFSAQTSANQTERIIDGKMEKRRKGVYGPPLQKQGIIFVDDLNMPQKEIYGAQPPIELLRQWMDYNGWYDIDTPEREFRSLIAVRFAAAMGPPGNGRNSVSNRYIRHFNTVYVEPFADESLKYIFSTVMDWLFISKPTPAFPLPVQGMKDQIVSNTIVIYKDAMLKFRPTPAKSHYCFNLRDVSKIFQGIAKSSGKAIVKEGDLIKLWAHECLRVFQDRLISMEDRDAFQAMISGIIKDKFKLDWNKLVTIQPLLFGSFVPLCFPGGDNTKKPYNDVYCELYDRDKLKKITEEQLADYNNFNHAKKMNLVLFNTAIEHVVKIHRIITTEFGHALLIGVGGSGRKSLTELAVFVATFESFQIEITSAYNFEAWRDDMRQKFFMTCGVDEKQTVFLFSDTQIVMESFLEDVNNVLNNGEIPNLYAAADEMANVMEAMMEQNKNVPGYKGLGQQQVWLDFQKKCKENVHIVLAMSPIGDDFKRRLRMFPSLVNCCAIDWFLPWPKEALQSVAEFFIKEVEDLPEKDGIVALCVDMQIRTTDLTLKYKEDEKRYYYVTPTSYLVLIQAFMLLLKEKRESIGSIINKYSKGIDQLADAKVQVDILKEQLIVLMPQLTQAKKETAEKIVEVDIQKKEVAIIRAGVEAEALVANEKKANADAIQKDCEFELSRVMPIYNAAIRAVQQLKKDDITEIKNFASPPPAAKIVVKTLCMMFDVKPKKIGTGKDAEMDYWDPGKKQVLTADLLKRCQTYDKDNISQALVDMLKPIINSEDYEDGKLANASKAAHGLAKWVRAMVQYDDAMKVVKPKQAELKVAKDSAAEAQAALDKATESLRKVEAQMQGLIDEFDAAKAKEQKLSDDFETAERKCSRAKSLIEKLGDEEVNWQEALEKNKNDKVNLVGDIVIASGVIAYMGVFSLDYRAESVKSWSKLLQQYHIFHNPKFQMKEVLGNGVKIQQWQIDGLPPEDFAIDNAIIMDNSERWPLMVDPQMQGNLWVKQMEKETIKSIKPTMDPKAQSRILKNAITLGDCVILEDANETFDPMMEPLLGKQIEKKGNSLMIKLGDEQIEYAKEFKFYITTKLSKPHYSPEVCVKVTMLNFMVTEEGLTDQMLNMVVTHEEPNKMKAYNDAIVKKAANKKKMNELEDKILNQISTSEVDILEDDILYETLDESKAQVQQIKQMEKESEVIVNQIDGYKETFTAVAYRVARLFFVLVQIMNVDPMYQYSLKFYKGIYLRALENGMAAYKGNRNERKTFYVKEFTKLLYEGICRSLFEKDKLLFSMLICFKIMDEVGNLDQREVRFIMTGGTSVEMKRPNPTGAQGWMTDKIWASILQISEVYPCFGGLDTNMEKNLDEWERIYNEQMPQEETWPSPFNELNLIRKAMFLRVFRSDKVIPIIQRLISEEKELGPSYIIPPPFDMEKSYLESFKKTPIIIVLSAGADPMNELQKLGALYKAHVTPVSLGQGQGPIAIEAINNARESQDWVCLQNCHLCPSFMPTLDGMIEDLDDTPSNFRIWLTSMPSDKFPVTILQNGVKATIEPPKGLKSNILRSYLGIDSSDFEDCSKPAAYKALMWGLCFFNAVLLERRKFGPLGWNIPYEFSNSDLSISQAQLKMFLDHYEGIPWEALRYMVAEANYGGRVTDPNDRFTVSLILEDFYCPDMLKPQHKLTTNGAYYVPPEGELDTYQDFLRSDLFPMTDQTEIFGLHDNAEITSALNITNAMLAVALSLQAAVSSGGSGGLSQDDQLKKIAADILEKIPANFDIEAASKRHPIKYEDSMNTVLQQELLRYNKLTGVVRASLINVGKAIKGEVPMSNELDGVCSSLFNNAVPAVWHKVSYPSLKPLASWILEFLQRLQFMQDWIDKNAPPNFWISGFFFTQSFLTGAKQNFARNHTIAIDLLDYDFQVISDETKYDLTTAPADGVYIHGLYVEGCRWDDRIEALAESAPKVLFTPMKTIWILPMKKADIDTGHSYTCPVYKTARRAGTLSTTGHSTNFVLYLSLPMQKKHTVKHWYKRGVAMLTGLSD